ncbi:unnamed protein product [Didymodactylos carnosus]|uniref:Transcription elongation factor NusA n=1 Tax=Didymodactylos carnosus TaxID=1234261 RepID=A0A8S2GY72_9BILA|nr:unnamed protein product [Didymodactylos carnosus]CAF3576472.1 unnamed protein product [Didymodactylos carnosus]
MNGKELLITLDLLQKEKHISRESIIEAIKDAVDKAYKREVDPEATIEVEFNEKTGEISVYNLLKVVKAEDLDDELTQLNLEEAQQLNHTLGLGDIYRRPIPFSEFSRIAALQVKQAIRQKLAEAQKVVLYDEWAPKIGTVINAQVEQVNPNGSILVDLGSSIFGFVTPGGSIPGEKIEPGKMYKFYVQDVPEVADGTIEIMAVARNPGERAKVAIRSNVSSIDPIGAIVGRKGARINAVSSQLKDERIDVVP